MTVAEMNVQDVSTKISVFRKILMATDLSEASRPALSFAVALAARYDSKLSVLHVFHPDWRYEMLDNPPEADLERADAQRQLSAVVDSVHPDRPLNRIVMRNASVPTAVLSGIAELGADLLVIGTHGRGGFSKLALGSVAEELLRTAPCPVVTIGPKARAVPSKPMDFRTIVFSTDFGAGSTKALPLVQRLVRAHDAKIIFLHMIPPIPAASSVVSAYAPAAPGAEEVQQWEASATKRSMQDLRSWVLAHGTFEGEPEYFVGTDFLAEGIFTAVNKWKADLIVMGTNRAASVRVSSHLPWTAVHQVIHDAECPVMTVAG